MTACDCMAYYIKEGRAIRSVNELHKFYQVLRYYDVSINDVAIQGCRYFYIRIDLFHARLYIAKEEFAGQEGSLFLSIPQEEWVIINGFVFAEVKA